MKSKSSSRPQPLLTEKTCGDCVHAYGWCLPSKTGKPMNCRCEVHPRFYKSPSDPACKDYKHGGEGPPETVTEMTSENRFADRVPRKVVPLFRPGEKKPWKLVPSDEIPAQGINWKGEPLDSEKKITKKRKKK